MPGAFTAREEVVPDSEEDRVWYASFVACGARPEISLTLLPFAPSSYFSSISHRADGQRGKRFRAYADVIDISSESENDGQYVCFPIFERCMILTRAIAVPIHMVSLRKRTLLNAVKRETEQHFSPRQCVRWLHQRSPRGRSRSLKHPVDGVLYTALIRRCPTLNPSPQLPYDRCAFCQML